jgi:hypothetical protein
VRHHQTAALIVAVAALFGPGARAYLKLGTSVNDRVVGVQWNAFPVQYFITSRDDDRVSAAELEAVVSRAFGTWGAVPSANVSAAFAGFTTAEPVVDDDQLSVIGFLDLPDMDRTLGAATFEIDETTGRLVAADIFFNSVFDWSVAPSGETGRFDLESVAVHEVGHVLGLGHSALGETELSGSGSRTVLGKRAVMFPIAYPRGSIEDRSLEADDIAGLSDIYTSGEFNRAFGAIRGRVRLDGQGLFGAHVTAFNIRTGALVAGFALSDQGDFVIAGLEPGLYIVRAEPLDDGDLESFFAEDTEVNLDFRATYFPRLVGVPEGGAGDVVEIAVTAK